MWEGKSDYTRQENYYYRNREKCIERAKLRYKNRDKSKPKVKKIKIAEKPIIYTSTDYIKISANYHKDHPETNNLTSIRQKRYISKKRSNGGSFTKEGWISLKLKYNYKCAICKLDEPFEQHYKYLTADHVIPVSKGGNGNINNIQPLCQKCNSSKHNKLDSIIKV